MSHEEICFKAIDLIKAVGNYVREEGKNLKHDNRELKDNNSFVTYVDKKAEDQLVQGLTRILPGAGFLTEEETEDIEGDTYRWFIDPIDGTTNFVYGIPVFCISVGLMEADKIVAGVVYEINREECFYAWKGGGAFLNGESIKVSRNKELSESLIGTGFPHRSEYMNEYVNLFREFMVNTRGVRRLGSAAVDLAYVACGRFDAFYEHNLSPWDVAAGALIVQEAGGSVTDFEGGDNFLFGGEIIAANKIHDEVLKVIKKTFSG